MKARIINSEDFGGAYSDDFLLDNKDNFINGQLVSEWVLTPILPNQFFIIKKWNGSSWYEGGTQEEIDIRNFEKTKETIRQFLAKKKQDGRNYFNEIELIITMQLAGMLIMDLVVVSEQIESILYKPLNYIKNGDYFSAMMLFNNQDTIPPTHPIVLNHWNEMKSYCIAYFNENYPKTTIE